MSKAISAIIATIMLLMISVSLIGVFYVFSSTLAGTTTSSGSQQASQLTSQLSMCMRIDSIVDNQVTLRNCGKGVIENNSLVVLFDDIKAVIRADTIQENSVGTVNVTVPGAWNLSQTNPNRKYSLVISNGATTAQALVELTQRKSNLVSYWSFDEGQGNITVDNSGNGNTGILKNATAAICFASGACPDWVNGKAGNGLQFDGVGDYVTKDVFPNFPSNEITTDFWIKTSDNGDGIFSYASASSDNDWLIFGSGNVAIYRGGTVFSGISINDNKWHFVAVSWKGSNGETRLYKDGILAYSGILSQGTSITGGGSFVIGQEQDTVGGGFDQSQAFNGMIDEARIWNKFLAPDETVVIKQII